MLPHLSTRPRRRGRGDDRGGAGGGCGRRPGRRDRDWGRAGRRHHDRVGRPRHCLWRGDSGNRARHREPERGPNRPRRRGRGPGPRRPRHRCRDHRPHGHHQEEADVDPPSRTRSGSEDDRGLHRPARRERPVQPVRGALGPPGITPTARLSRRSWPRSPRRAPHSLPGGSRSSQPKSKASSPCQASVSVPPGAEPDSGTRSEPSRSAAPASSDGGSCPSG